METPVHTKAAIRAVLARKHHAELNHTFRTPADIVQAVRHVSNVELKDGSVYPAIAAMKSDGEIEESRDASYSWRSILRLTAKGLRISDQEREVVLGLYLLSDPRRMRALASKSAKTPAAPAKKKSAAKKKTKARARSPRGRDRRRAA